MALINRDKDVSEQRNVFTGTAVNTVVGGTYPIWTAPYPCTLDAASQIAFGLSGAPNHSLWLYRFVVGAGLTQVAVLGQSMASAAYGTSGAQTFTIVSGSGTSYPLQAGDALFLISAAANTGAQLVQVELVVKALQDIKTSFGV